MSDEQNKDQSPAGEDSKVPEKASDTKDPSCCYMADPCSFYVNPCCLPVSCCC